MNENDLFLKIVTTGIGIFGVFIFVTMPIVFNKMKYDGTRLGFGAVLSILPFVFVVSALAGMLVVLNTFGGEPTWVIYVLVVSSMIGAFTFWQEYLRYLFK